MTHALVLGEVATTALALLLIVAVGAFCGLLVHWTWVVKERLLAAVARRLDVPYRQRKAWWQR